MRRIPTPALTHLALIGLVSLSGLGCGEDKPIQVGVVLPLSGEHASYGEASRKGIELAFEELAAGAGDAPRLDLALADSGSDPAKARQLLDEHYENGALVAVGGLTSREAEEMVPVLEERDRVLVSPSASDPSLSRKTRNLYRLAPSDSTAASKMADFASRHLNVARVVMISEDPERTHELEDAFRASLESHSGELLEVAAAPAAPAERAALVERLVGLAPDAVYLAGYEATIGALISELRRAELPGKILTTQAFASPAAIARVGEDAVGVLLTQSAFELASEAPHVQSFVARYREKYGEEPDVFAAEGYDAVKVLAAALAGRPAMPGEVTKGLRDAVKDYPGVTGAVQFDEAHAVRKYPRVYSIGDDLSLHDHGRILEARQDEIRRKREDLQRRIEALRDQQATAAMGG